MVELTDPAIISMGNLKGHKYPGILSTVHNMHGVILHLHGFPGEPFEETVFMHQLFMKKGYGILSFNYPGFWGRKPAFSPELVLEGVKIALNYLLDKFDLPILFFAESFGASVATSIIAHDYNPRIKALACRAPVPDLSIFSADRRPSDNRSMAILIESLVDGKIMETSVNDWDNFPDEVISKFSTVKNLEMIKSANPEFPIFAIFGKNDEVLSSKAMENAYQDFAVLKILPILSHNIISIDQWKYIIDKFDKFYLASL
jgi:pimeloyl-ACP methyl ester carboxylesterase